MVFGWPRLINGAFKFHGLDDQVRKIGVFDAEVSILPLLIFSFLRFDLRVFVGNVHHIDQEPRVFPLTAHWKREVLQPSSKDIFVHPFFCNVQFGKSLFLKQGVRTIPNNDP